MLNSAVPLIITKVNNAPKYAKIVMEKLISKIKITKLLATANKIVSMLLKPLKSKILLKIVSGPIKVSKRFVVDIDADDECACADLFKNSPRNTG